MDSRSLPTTEIWLCAGDVHLVCVLLLKCVMITTWYGGLRHAAQRVCINMFASFAGMIFLGILVYGFLITSVVSLMSLYTTHDDVDTEEDPDQYEQAQMCDAVDTVHTTSPVKTVCETTDIGASMDGCSSLGWGTPCVASEDENEPGIEPGIEPGSDGSERSEGSDVSEDSQYIDGDEGGIECSIQVAQKRHGILAYDD